MQSYVRWSPCTYVYMGVGVALAFVPWRLLRRQQSRSCAGTLTNAGNACHHGNSPEGCDVCWTNRSWRAGCTANQRRAVATAARSARAHVVVGASVTLPFIMLTLLSALTWLICVVDVVVVVVRSSVGPCVRLVWVDHGVLDTSLLQMHFYDYEPAACCITRCNRRSNCSCNCCYNGCSNSGNCLDSCIVYSSFSSLQWCEVVRIAP